MSVNLLQPQNQMIHKLGANAYQSFTIDPQKRVKYTGMNYRSKGILVFSATWCHYCQALAPILVQLDQFTNGDVPIVTIDPDQDKVLQQVFANNGLKIEGFPTIFIMDVDGRVLHEPYKGPRTLEGMYMATQTVQSCQTTCSSGNLVTGSQLMKAMHGYTQPSSLYSTTRELAPLTGPQSQQKMLAQ